MENLFDQGSPSTEFHWIITDDPALAQDFITKNNLPSSSTEAEFKELMLKELSPKYEMETNLDFNLRKVMFFNGWLRNYCFEEKYNSITIVSIISKNELGSGAAFYKPKDYPEAFLFLTQSVWAIFTDGTNINIRGRISRR